MSVWCYKCENYIYHAKIEDFLINLEFHKFKNELEKPREKVLNSKNNFKTGLFYEENYESLMNLHYFDPNK